MARSASGIRRLDDCVDRMRATRRELADAAASAAVAPVGAWDFTVAKHPQAVNRATEERRETALKMRAYRRLLAECRGQYSSIDRRAIQAAAVRAKTARANLVALANEEFDRRGAFVYALHGDTWLASPFEDTVPISTLETAITFRGHIHIRLNPNGRADLRLPPFWSGGPVPDDPSLYDWLGMAVLSVHFFTSSGMIPNCDSCQSWLLGLPETRPSVREIIIKDGASGLIPGRQICLGDRFDFFKTTDAADPLTRLLETEGILRHAPVRAPYVTAEDLVSLYYCSTDACRVLTVRGFDSAGPETLPCPNCTGTSHPLFPQFWRDWRAKYPPAEPCSRCPHCDRSCQRDTMVEFPHISGYRPICASCYARTGAPCALCDRPNYQNRMLRISAYRPTMSPRAEEVYVCSDTPPLGQSDSCAYAVSRWSDYVCPRCGIATVYHETPVSDSEQVICSRCAGLETR